jgi:hypothetical protein
MKKWIPHQVRNGRKILSMSTIKDKEEEKEIGFTPLIIAGTLIVLVWIFTPIIIYYNFYDWSKSGAFGDLFGVVNALFSGLAFAGIIYTILLQRKELKLQRQELEETRNELKRSADAQEKSERVFLKQVELMNKTARLNGLSSIIEHNNALKQIEITKGRANLLTMRSTSSNYIQKIEKILNDLEDSESKE